MIHYRHLYQHSTYVFMSYEHILIVTRNYFCSTTDTYVEFIQIRTTVLDILLFTFSKKETK